MRQPTLKDFGGKACVAAFYCWLDLSGGSVSSLVKETSDFLPKSMTILSFEHKTLLNMKLLNE